MTLSMRKQNPRVRSAMTLAKRLTTKTIKTLAALSLSAVSAHAAPERQVLTMDDGSALVTEISRGAPEKPVFVLLGDMLSELRSSDSLAHSLEIQGHSVVRYSYTGQVDNLRLLKAGEEPRAFTEGLDLGDLAAELDQVLNKLSITGKVHLVGMSYGAAVASEYATRHPENVDTLILVAPLVSPLDHYDPNGRTLRLWLTGVRFWENAPCAIYGFFNPWLCTTNDYWYDSFFRALHKTPTVELTKEVPVGVEEAAYKKGVYHLLRAARDFDLRSYAYKLKNVHLIIAGEEEKQLKLNQELAWNLVKKAEKRSLAVIKGASHDLETSSPVATATWLDAVSRKEESLQKGTRHEINADPKP